MPLHDRRDATTWRRATASVDRVSGRAERRTWWWSFALIGVAFLAWSLATPTLGGPDESQHAIRAAAMARGQWTGEPVRIFGWHSRFRVPEDYARFREAACFQLPTRPELRTPACAPDLDGSGRLVDVTTYEFRGFPPYYALVGWPTLGLPDGTGMNAMRLIHAAACAALVASALCTAMRRSDQRLLVTGVIAATTPMVWYLAGVLNPNGLEIAAALSLWVAALALACGSTETDAVLVRRAGIALVVLVSVRSLGPLYAVTAIGMAAWLAGLPRLSGLVRRRDVRIWGGVAATVTALHGLWVVLVAMRYPEERVAIGIADTIDAWPQLLKETIGVLGFNDLPIPTAVYAVWGAAAIALVAFGFATASTRGRLVLGATVLVAFVIPTSANAFNVPPIGFGWQGRYGLPLTIGVVLVAAAVADPRRLRGARPLLTALGSTLLATQVVAFVATGRRLGVGSPKGWNPFDYLLDPVWSPRVPPELLLVAFCGAVIGIGLCCYRTPHTSESPAPPGTEPAARRR